MRERTSQPSVPAADRHVERVTALRRAVFESDAVTDRAMRSAAAGPAAGAELPPQLASYLTDVRRRRIA
ncbi:MAG: hypothetical protein LC808_02890 [Actinobacteria bacterium]|nr:hypothetical protein [Actinomycetota bacterium]